MRKKIIAGLLALVVLVAPATVMANPITIDTGAVISAVADASRFIVVDGGQGYMPLRSVVEAYGGHVAWNGADNTVTISFAATEIAATFSALTGVALPEMVAGRFSITLEQLGNRLRIVNGPAAGTFIVSRIVNDRIMLPVQHLDPVSVIASIPAIENSIHWGLVREGIMAITGASGVSHSVDANGITITLQ
ncbi:MAG: copper amine oxidase N-terminal domain-containing protein [Defluviitaleaceae bacterium]|nr:copper amine oxidase N-terminal domain-containing protein [Defluviitaleaceae bacterium]